MTIEKIKDYLKKYNIKSDIKGNEVLITEKSDYNGIKVWVEVTLEYDKNVNVKFYISEKINVLGKEIEVKDYVYMNRVVERDFRDIRYWRKISKNIVTHYKNPIAVIGYIKTYGEIYDTVKMVRFNELFEVDRLSVRLGEKGVSIKTTIDNYNLSLFTGKYYLLLDSLETLEFIYKNKPFLDKLKEILELNKMIVEKTKELVNMYKTFKLI